MPFGRKRSRHNQKRAPMIRESEDETRAAVFHADLNIGGNLRRSRSETNQLLTRVTPHIVVVLRGSLWVSEGRSTLILWGGGNDGHFGSTEHGVHRDRSVFLNCQLRLWVRIPNTPGTEARIKQASN